MTRFERLYSCMVVGGALAALALLIAVPLSPAAREAHAQTAAKKDAKKDAKAKSAKPAETVALTDETDDPKVWAKLFPLHYELYAKTTDMQRTKYGGSDGVPHTPTDADPRSIVSRSKVEEDIGLRLMWAGYAFAADFREERGHAYMLDDQKFTLRQKVVQQPGACLNCHASAYVAQKKAGGGDLTKGFEKMNAMPFSEAGEARAITRSRASTATIRPRWHCASRVRHFMEGMRAFKASQGVKDYDVNKQATPAEMRAYVCGQCHVEYYFQGAEKRLVFPWSKGLKVEQIHAYYDEIKFRDWTHADTGAPTLKAQHPEFEMWSQGIHARAGVTCSDCHMPKIQHKGSTLSDHWVRSPVLNIRNACMGCHQKARFHRDREGVEGARRTDTGPSLALAAAGDGRADRSHLGSQDRERCEEERLGARDCPLSTTPGAVLSRFRRSRELDGLPCASGSSAHPCRVAELLAAGAARRARPDVQADGGDRRSSTAAGASEEIESIRPDIRRLRDLAVFREIDLEDVGGLFGCAGDHVGAE